MMRVVGGEAETESWSIDLPVGIDEAIHGL